MHPAFAAAAFDILVIEDRQPPFAVLTHGFDERHARASPQASETHPAPVFGPSREVRYEVNREQSMAAAAAGRAGEEGPAGGGPRRPGPHPLAQGGAAAARGNAPSAGRPQHAKPRL